MVTLAILSVLLGAILGRIFKSYVLVPVSWLAAVVVLGCLAQLEQNIFDWVTQIAVATACIQFGYAIGLMFATASNRDQDS